MGDNCEFESRVELRLNNHMLAEHEIGEQFSCDECDFGVVERSEMMKHVETSMEKNINYVVEIVRTECTKKKTLFVENVKQSRA